jgi:N-acetylglucosaminyldiphosphoundecaprenol N-acetyl-beta-D-mannosaminyltransferase
MSLQELSPIPMASLFDIGVSVVTMDTAVEAIMTAAAQRRSLAVTALAVHGLIEALNDPEMREAVGRMDIVTPDGQPVRWALNILCGTRLPDRVYGPDLMRALCRRAAAEGIAVYLFGSTLDTCKRLVAKLEKDHPGLRIAGVQPDRFREATAAEDGADVRAISGSGAGIVFVGRGCPRQEKWVAAHKGRVAAAAVAVGAAFDFIAGNRSEPPRWMQRAGLQWLWRLILDPRRLWKRYLIANSWFILYFLRELSLKPLR